MPELTRDELTVTAANATAAAYHTDARNRQNARAKAGLRKEPVEDHFGDCGDYLFGLGSAVNSSLATPVSEVRSDTESETSSVAGSVKCLDEGMVSLAAHLLTGPPLRQDRNFHVATSMHELALLAQDLLIT